MIKKTMTALVTGATGFIGGRLCVALQAQGARVIGQGRRAKPGAWDAFLPLDLADDTVTGERLRGVDTVFHLAGVVHQPRSAAASHQIYRKVNVEGTGRLLSAAAQAGVSRFVFFSSASVHGEGHEGCIDETAPRSGQSAYALSKTAAEDMVLDTTSIHHCCILRPPLVYGPGCPGNLAHMIRAVRRGLFPPLPQVRNQRSMVHVDDLVQAAILVASHPAASGKAYIVSDDRVYSTFQIHRWICDALGRRPPERGVPLTLLRAAAALGDVLNAVSGGRSPLTRTTLQKLTGNACYSSALIRSELGFRNLNNLESTMQTIVEAC